MRIQTLFRSLDKSEALQAYLEQKIGASVENFLKYQPNTTAAVRIELDRRRSQTRKPLFHCEIILKPTRSKQPIKISKHAEDVYSAVSEATAALKTVLSRRSAKKAQHRRHEYSHERRDLAA
jgi:ribosomal subunit interface protein